MNTSGSIAPGVLHETGDDGSGGILFSCSPPEGISRSLLVSNKESPVILLPSKPPITFIPLPIGRKQV